MPSGGGVLARFHKPGVGVLNSFLPVGWGIRPSKNLPRGGLELTDTLLQLNRRVNLIWVPNSYICIRFFA